MKVNDLLDASKPPVINLDSRAAAGVSRVALVADLRMQEIPT